MKSVTAKFKSGGLHQKHVVATWDLGNRLSICLQAQGNQKNQYDPSSSYICLILAQEI